MPKPLSTKQERYLHANNIDHSHSHKNADVTFEGKDPKHKITIPSKDGKAPNYSWLQRGK